MTRFWGQWPVVSCMLSRSDDLVPCKQQITVMEVSPGADAKSPTKLLEAWVGGWLMLVTPSRDALESSCNVGSVMEDDPFLKFIDRWSTNGGLLLGSFIGIALGLGLEKLLENFMDWTKAGMAVTGIYSAGLIVWLSQPSFEDLQRDLDSIATYHT
eukprot:s2639_g5.t1